MAAMDEAVDWAPAHAWLAVLRRAAGGEKSALDLKVGLLPLTVPELRRLLRHPVWARSPDREAARAWSQWRRRHQQRSRQSH